jgi:hypothetical protein
MLMMDLIRLLRQKLRLRSVETICVFINGSVIAHPTMSIIELYEQYCDDDGFLYIMYTEQEAFG